MLKHGPSKEFLGAICIALAVALITVLLAPPYQPRQTSEIKSEQQSDRDLGGQQNNNRTEAPKDNRNEAEEGNSNASEYWTVLGRHVKITEALLVLFTFTLWWATRDLVKGGADTSKRQLRAYISSFPSFIFSFNENEYPRARFKIINTGTTPAHNLRHRGDVIVASEPLIGGSSFPELTSPFSSPIVAFPNLPFFGNIRATNIVTKADVARIRSGGARLYVYGEVLYDDAFSEEQVTRFCACVAANSAILVKLTSNYEPEDLKVDFQAAPMGNTAT